MCSLTSEEDELGEDDGESEDKEEVEDVTSV